MREAIGSRMQLADFEQRCLDVLKYTANPWEIESVRTSNKPIAEPWVSHCSDINVE